MLQPTLAFLCDCIASALLARYGIVRPPVPLREMLSAPPPDLSQDLSLTESLPFGDALWLRPHGGQASVFVNPDLPESHKRYAMARAMFVGLCKSKGGQAVGLPYVPNDELNAQMDLFARRLLLAPSLLPPGWDRLPPEQLANLCGVPVPVAEERLRERQLEAARPSHL